MNMPNKGLAPKDMNESCNSITNFKKPVFEENQQDLSKFFIRHQMIDTHVESTQHH